MKEAINSKFLLSLSIGLVAFSSALHMAHDIPDTAFDVFSSVLFAAAVLFLLWVVFFVLRPQSHNVAVAMDLMRMHQRVASAANEANTIEEGLQAGIDAICEYTGWPVGHAYLYSEEKQALLNLDIWKLSNEERFAAFKQVSEQEQFISGQDFIGEVYADSTPMWILDVKESSVYRRRETAIAAGLKAAFGFPVFVNRKAVAVIEFYSFEAKIPDETLLSAMATVGKQLGQVIERCRSRERAKLLETVITSANDAIIITKADLTAPGPEIVYVNEAFTRISGYSAKEVIGQSPRLLQGEFTNQDTLRQLKESLVKGQAFKAELLNYHKSGTPYWLDISIVPVRDEAGIITHFAAIERDITERKESEKRYKDTLVQLKRASLKAEAAARDLQESLDKAEEANKAKSNFLANMSHELRTPMNGVLGMAHLLHETELNEEQDTLVSTINGSAETLLMLLNDILDFSKIEAGALILEHIPHPIREEIYETANLFRPQVDKKAIDLVVDCDGDIPSHIWGDPGRVRQVLTNLMGNAIKFTDRGYVHLAAKLQEHAGKTLLHFRIEDTGIGIPADKLGEIFDKFTQADSSVTRKYGGTGLGLAISKHLVEIMGGTIGVESVVGKGSTFWFTLPCTPASQSDVEHATERKTSDLFTHIQRIPVGAAKALLVEDYPVNQLFAEKLLRKFGFTHIDIAENGAQALMKYRTHPYDIIFMDCQMPEMDGYQTTEKIRSFETDTPLHTPIVAMTANAMMGDREKCLKSGMDDYISKPLKSDHLRIILQAWFVLEDEKPRPESRKKHIAVKEETEEPPVDMEQLRIFTNDDAEEEKSLAAFFLEQAEETLQKLEQSLTEADNEAWKSAAHRFKGSSGNFGAMKLHHLCKRAEMDFEETTVHKRETLAAIIAETGRVRNYFARKA